MLGLTVNPRVAGSVRLEDVGRPDPAEGSVFVEALALGICGTDREIVAGSYGWPTPDSDRLILGHESLGRVEEAPEGSGLARGDHIVGIVRRPDAVPCRACAGGEWDMCLNGEYTERGIKQRNGYGSQYFRIEPEFAVRVDPALGLRAVLLEPASVLAKAWDHIGHIGQRSRSWRPHTVLVTGAGPVGLLGALLARQRDLELHVFDRAEHGVKPDLVAAMGGTYHTGSLAKLRGLRPDVILECTGAVEVITEVITHNSHNAIVCLAGVSQRERDVTLDMGNLNRTIVLQNDVVFGSVNANHRHYLQGAEALARADGDWLDRLITRRLPLARWQEALVNEPDDIKVVIDFSL